VGKGEIGFCLNANFASDSSTSVAELIKQLNVIYNVVNFANNNNNLDIHEASMSVAKT
jgi:hypothetical protein